VNREVIVSREAGSDIADAVAWFRDRSPELLERFRAEFETVYASIVEHPDMYPIVHRKLHRALLRRFPYSVFYLVEPSAILILAVMHQARDQSNWKRRA
jgi:plasmid stabilization system protein ParE